MKYDFLQLTDETLDVRAPALAQLLSTPSRKVGRFDAVGVIVLLERYVIRKVDDNAPDLMAEMRACAFLPKDRANHMLSMATEWPEKLCPVLLEALADPDVRVLEKAPGGWQVRCIAERYGRLAHERRASRERTRDNARARAAGWEPGDGKSWQHRTTGEILPSLRDVIARIDGDR